MINEIRLGGKNIQTAAASLVSAANLSRERPKIRISIDNFTLALFHRSDQFTHCRTVRVQVNAMHGTDGFPFRRLWCGYFLVVIKSTENLACWIKYVSISISFDHYLTTRIVGYEHTSLIGPVPAAVQQWCYSKRLFFRNEQTKSCQTNASSGIKKLNFFFFLQLCLY